MPAAILGRKIGMTRYFMEDGTSVPVTVIQAGPCAVTQVKTPQSDGYSAVQIAFEDIKPRRSTMAVIGHDAKAGVSPKRVHRELRLADEKQAGEFEVGKQINVSVFDGIKYVDVVGTSKGKGFQGVMVRHNFKGMFASHGNERMHRHGGSIGGHATNRGWGPKPKKGKRMGGHLGDERVTTRNLDVISIDPEQNLMLVKGAVPGPRQGLLFKAIRLNRSKARKVAEAGK
jgi:large subunit ribosomal protein L3